MLDAVDVLTGVTHIEEFFIASDDADFTSLVQRFRAADRRTTVIVAGAVATAYRQMADTVIQSYDFLAMLCGTANSETAVGPAHPQPAIATGTDMTSPSTATTVVREFVTTASGPVKGAVVAHCALSADPLLANDWGGHGKFGTWVAQIDDNIEYAPSPTPGWVWDSKRFSLDDLPSEINVEMTSTIEQQVTRVTDMPALSAMQYRQVLLSLAQRGSSHLGV